eukprot:Skav228577  [mRNA]  locus=scaffold1470:41531:60272:+ [translate_table: standard]
MPLQALFMEKVPEEGDEEAEAEVEEQDEGDEEEVEEEEPPPPEDEEEEEQRPKWRVAQSVAGILSGPRLCENIRRVQECQSGRGLGPCLHFDTLSIRGSHTEVDGTASTAEFFSEQCGLQMLPINVDVCTEEEAFQATRVHMESKGQFFNYLRTSKSGTWLPHGSAWLHWLALQEHAKKEAALREKLAHEEETRRKVCKEQPEDPIEFLAQYLRETLPVPDVPSEDLCLSISALGKRSLWENALELLFESFQGGQGSGSAEFLFCGSAESAEEESRHGTAAGHRALPWAPPWWVGVSL